MPPSVLTTKKNAATIELFRKAIAAHLDDAGTVLRGTYVWVPGSKVYFNAATNNAVIIDKVGNFVGGFKLIPGSKKYINYIKSVALQ